MGMSEMYLRKNEGKQEGGNVPTVVGNVSTVVGNVSMGYGGNVSMGMSEMYLRGNEGKQEGGNVPTVVRNVSMVCKDFIHSKSIVLINIGHVMCFKTLI